MPLENLPSTRDPHDVLATGDLDSLCRALFSDQKSTQSQDKSPTFNSQTWLNANSSSVTHCHDIRYSVKKAMLRMYAISAQFEKWALILSAHPL